jgi:hypothetical protein
MSEKEYNEATEELYFLFMFKNKNLTIQEIEECLERGAQLHGVKCYRGNLLAIGILFDVKPEILQYLIDKGVKDDKLLTTYYVNTDEKTNKKAFRIKVYGDTKTGLITWFYYINNDLSLLNLFKDKLNISSNPIYRFPIKEEKIKKNIEQFNEYCKILRYPLFENFKTFAEECLELPDNVEDFEHLFDLWDPFEEYIL